MKLAILADRERHGALRSALSSESLISEPVFYPNYDDFVRGLPESRCDAVIVAHRGALGMQSVRAARILLRRVPIIWISDDDGFLEEAYRLGCAYFSTATISEKLLTAALQRCEI